MKVIVQQQNLKKAVHMVDHLSTKNLSLPILSNIILKTDSGRLRILATNLEIGITSFLQGRVEESGEVAVPARILSDLVNTVPDGNVTLSVKNNNLTISADSYKTTILGADTKEYPTIPKLKGPPIALIPGPILKNVCSTVIDSMATTETRPELYGLYTQFKENFVVFAATDSFRLVERKIQNKNNSKHTLIIPRNTILELIRISGEVEDEFEIRVSDNQLALTSGDVEIVSRLIDGVYPDYEKVIPNRSVSRILVGKNELEKNIRLAGLFASNISDVNMQCNNDHITISAKNTEKGDVNAKTNAVLKNDPFEIALNFNYLLDGLKVMPSDKVVIEFTGQSSPLVLKPDGDGNNLVYIIMPLRS